MCRTTVTTSGVEGLYLMDEDGRLDHAIRFQNTGTDTAFFVVIMDTLQATLDPATLELGAASHGMSMVVRDNVLKFMFPNILLPDSNTNEPRSHGFVTYSIEPRQPVLPGTVIENIANIFFDYNDPVITEPSVLTAEFSTGVSANTDPKVLLLPNPARDAFEIRGLRRELLRVDLLAIDGRVVRSFSGSDGERRFALGGIASGAYIAALTLRNGTAIRLPLIIEHH